MFPPHSLYSWMPSTVSSTRPSEEAVTCDISSSSSYIVFVGKADSGYPLRYFINVVIICLLRNHGVGLRESQWDVMIHPLKVRL